MDFRLQVFEGNTIDLVFQLKKFKQRVGWNLTGVTAIRLEFDGVDGSPFTYAVADPNHAEAAWATGRVIVRVSPQTITAAVGSYAAGITVFFPGEEITVAAGVIEVCDRPGYPWP